MKSLEKWADRVYSENDFGRSIATSLSGLIGLALYLLTDDWIIAAFSAIISFPVIRLVSTGINEKVDRKKQRNIEKGNTAYEYQKLSEQEKLVVNAFVKAGGSVLTWGQINRSNLSFSAIESLIQREVLWTSVTADGFTETFNLNSNIFDIANEEWSESS